MITSYLKKIKFLYVILFWLLFWQIGASLINSSFRLPHVIESLVNLFETLKIPKTYSVIWTTFSTYILFFWLSLIISIMCATFAYKNEYVKNILSPLYAISKAAPVVSTLYILLFIFQTKFVFFIVVLFHIFPLLYIGILTALESIEKKYLIHNKVQKIKFSVQMKKFYIPITLNRCKSSIYSASSLGLKAIIASEILTSQNSGIGGMIRDANGAISAIDLITWIIISCSLAIGFDKLLRWSGGKLW